MKESDCKKYRSCGCCKKKRKWTAADLREHVRACDIVATGQLPITEATRKFLAATAVLAS